MKKIKKHSINKNFTIDKALEYMNKEKVNTLFVVDSSKKILGVFTSGDFRNVALKGIKLNQPIYKFMNKFYKYSLINNQKKNTHFFINDNTLQDLPVLNKKNKIINIISRKNLKLKFKSLNYVDSVIVAGGKGTRMKPYTNVIPKPLMPFKNKSILENIIDNLVGQGIRKVNLTLNYKKNLIKSFLNNKSKNISFIDENKPLGTVGSLRLIRNLSKTFCLTNCDTILDIDYQEMYKFHKENNCDITLAVVYKKFKNQYGLCDVKENNLIKIEEKPNFNQLINAGFYFVEKKLIKLIPRGKRFDADQWIKLILKNKLNVKVYPVPDNCWLDLGKMDNFINESIDK